MCFCLFLIAMWLVVRWAVCHRPFRDGTNHAQHFFFCCARDEASLSSFSVFACLQNPLAAFAAFAATPISATASRPKIHTFFCVSNTRLTSCT